jgi:hypothetical protein
LRAIRGRFVRACALLAAGLIAIGLSADWRDRIIAPGPLARQHAQLIARPRAVANCAACHAAAEQHTGGWAISLITRSQKGKSQPQLCMKCHAKTISKGLALAAHNLPARALSELTNSQTALVSATEPDTARVPKEDKEHGLHLSETTATSLACSACHREHHGVQFDLTAIDDVACQSCHRQRFESFTTDHPDFGIWPYERRTRIAFNHASHRDKHFAEKQRSFDCASCHTQDTIGKTERTVSYERACAACHDEKISTSVARDVPMFALPTMDIATMRSAGLNVGTWPKGATGDFDGRLPPAMKLLLAADPAAASAMAKLGASFDFQDVNPDDRQQLDACAALTTAIARLMVELSQSPGATIRARLQVTLGRPISDTDAANLAAGLSSDTLQVAAEHWLGAKPAKRGASPTDNANKSTSPSASAEPIVFAPAGKWSRDEPSFSIRYRPSAHADPVLATWLNVLANTPDSSRGGIVAAMFKELSKTNAPGLCASCHSVEQVLPNRIAINWRATDRGTEPRGFTKFSHQPHRLLPQLSDCTYCHTIDPKAAGSTIYTGRNSATFASDFKPIVKQACATCHTAQAAGDQCQKCHNYHVERVENWRGKSSTVNALRSARGSWWDAR